MENTVWIVAAKRTPMGSFQGCLSSLSAPELGAHAIRSVLKQSHLPPERIDEVFMGCVLPAGCGQAPARQAALGADIPYSVPCTTLNKVCGSGMKSVMLGYDLIQSQSLKTVVAGGMESMSNAPYFMPAARTGFRLGHGEVRDHMFWDGLQDAYEGKLMGVYAQKAADDYHFSREAMDEWALISLGRAKKAIEAGLFNAEVEPMEVTVRRSLTTIDHDEAPFAVNEEKIPHLKAAFVEHNSNGHAVGSVTAANSSSISDGAAALILMDSEEAKKQGLAPLAIIKGHTTHARAPSEFTIAPKFAIESLLTKLEWSVEEVDLWEINEAFAMVTQYAVKELKLNPDLVNVHGGACALGHPIGASGARIIVTLIHALRQRGARKGIASLCIGGGEATAIAIEVP